MALNLTIDVNLEYFEEKRLSQLELTASSDETAAFVITASHVLLTALAPTLSASSSLSILEKRPKSPRWAAFFLSPTITESALQDSKVGNSSMIWYDPESTRQLSRRLLAMVHPFLAENFYLKGIISVQNPRHSPADIVLLDLSHSPSEVADHLLQVTNGQIVHSGPEAILKTILISQLNFQWGGHGASPNISVPAAAAAAAASPAPLPLPADFGLPTCPVCLHRIDPGLLGLPPPPPHQICSQFCSPPNLGSPLSTNHELSSCTQQRLLRPWPSPCHCSACQVIQSYWKSQVGSVYPSGDGGRDYTNNRDHLRCYQCDLTETLWVCITCGYVGCGRYSNRHSVEHYECSGHPYSLELATLRIWDYVTSDFSHRSDLLICPSSPPLLFPLVLQQDQRPGRAHASRGGVAIGNGDVVSASVGLDIVKSPKKAFMIGEEYEALLQSALEEQAQHYEGEISALRARLSADHFDQNTMTAQDKDEIECQRGEIASLRTEIDRLSRDLVELQAQEAGQRATTQSLLREQQVVQDLLNTIKKETTREQAEGAIQVEELEQQIADLTANQKMRYQFSQDDELQQAQIWGMSDNTPASKNNKRGKKTKRIFRK